MVDGEEEAEPLTLYVVFVRAAARGVDVEPKEEGRA
jgi:hypothetical protein